MPPADALTPVLPAAAPAPALIAPGALQALSAWGLLVLVDVALKVAGFDRFYRMVRAWPTRGAAPAAQRHDRSAKAVAAVYRARTWYFKRAWCLQSAAATVCLLRLRGVDATLVIGVRKIPFSAHAWTEVDGVAVNNLHPETAPLYRVITRC